jgi:hypothetical protein
VHGSLVRLGLALGVFVELSSRDPGTAADLVRTVLEAYYGRAWLDSRFEATELMRLPPDPLGEGLFPLARLPLALRRLGEALSELPRENTPSRFE